MALLNRPLTDAEAQAILESWRTSPLSSGLSELWRCLIAKGERNQYVRYDAKLDRVAYEDIETFYFTREESPSDSRWMVPK